MPSLNNSEWQPIETYFCEPYSKGDVVLIYDPGYGVKEARGNLYNWDDEDLLCQVVEFKSNYYDYGSYKPTHWMPLPKGPK